MKSARIVTKMPTILGITQVFGVGKLFEQAGEFAERFANCVVLTLSKAVFGIIIVGLNHASNDRLLAADTELRERFLNEAPNGWKKMSDLLLHSRGKVKLKVYVLGDGDEKLQYTVDSDFAFNGVRQRRVEAITTWAHDGRQVLYANARNAENAFEVQGAVGSEKRFALNNLYIDPTLGIWDTQDLAEDGTWQVDAVINGPFGINPSPLSEICKSPSFEIEDLYVSDAGVSVAFKDKHPIDGTYREVTMIVDPENSWAVSQYHIEYPSPKKRDLQLASDVKIEYEDNPFEETQLRLPKRAIEIQGTAEQVKNGAGERFEYSLIEFVRSDVPEREFTLASFGLTTTGESLARRERTKPISWLLFVSGGILLAFLGFCLTRRRKKSNPNNEDC